MEVDIKGLFICGAPRSGTTLLRSILSSHSQIIVTPESHFFSKWVSLYGKDKKFDQDELDCFLEQLHKWDQFLNFQIDPDEFDARLKVKVKTVSLATVFNTLVTCYAENENKPIWCEKTPYNELFLREIRDWYPHALLIYIARDPRAVISSLLKTPWASKNIYMNVLKWGGSVRIYEQNREEFLFLRYEDLVDEPKATITVLCEKLGIDFEEGMLQQRGASIRENRDGWAKEALTIATREIDPKVKEKWRQHLTPSQVWFIERLLTKEMERFEYTKSAPRVSFRGLMELLVSMILYYKSKLRMVRLNP